MTINWAIENSLGERHYEQFPTLQAAADAHPLAHSIWQVGKGKKVLGYRSDVSGVWHGRCLKAARALGQQVYITGYLVSGAETTYGNWACSGCGKPLCKQL